MSSRFFLLVAAGLTAAGCHTVEAGPQPGLSATATSTGAQTSTSAPTTATTGTAAAPASTTPTQLSLASGASLTIPAGASASPMNNAAQRLPGVVKAAHKYQLGDKKKLLLVNEMDREGLACKAVLDRELERANKAKDDTNEQRKALRKVNGVTEIKVGKERALYAVSGNRAPAPGASEVDTSTARIGVATLIMCRNEDYVVLMHAAEKGAEPAATKKMLVGIAASYKPAT